MSKFLLFLSIFTFSCSTFVQAEVLIELSDKRLPVFNLPMLQDNEDYYLIEEDSVNNVSYVAKNSCDNFVIVAVTRNKKIFFSETDISTMLGIAYNYVDIFCPLANKIVFTASTSVTPELEDILFKTSIVRQHDWVEEKEFRKNYALLQEIERIQKLKSELSKKTPLELLAYLLGATKLDNLPSLSLEALQKEQKINALLQITSFDDEASTSAFPIVAKVYDLPKEVGYFLVSGALSSSAGNQSLLDSVITVDSFIKCQKSGCSDMYNIDNIIKEGLL